MLGQISGANHLFPPAHLRIGPQPVRGDSGFIDLVCDTGIIPQGVISTYVVSSAITAIGTMITVQLRRNTKEWASSVGCVVLPRSKRSRINWFLVLGFNFMDCQKETCQRQRDF